MGLDSITLAAAKKYTDEKMFNCITIDCGEGGTYDLQLENGVTYILKNIGLKDTTITIDFNEAFSHVLLKTATSTSLLKTVSINLIGYTAITGQTLDGSELAWKEIWELISYDGLVATTKWEVEQ